jgi:hypothetical protein
VLHLNKHTVENAGNFPEQRLNTFRAFWNLDVEKLFNCERAAKLVCHWEGVRVAPQYHIVNMRSPMET